MRIPLLLATLVTLPFVTQAQGTLTVEVVLNKPEAGGQLMLLLCPSKEAYDKDEGCTPRIVKADGRTVRITFTDVTPGTYAVKVFHDINSDRKLNTNWVGWPQEPFGFGNDAPIKMGPPSFEAAAVQVKAGAQTTRVNLR
ncbi:MAG: DUF2141 domain-containing protein [Flavobacteriales bacterium]